MATQLGIRFRPGTCRRCGGDAYLDMADDGEWRCLQCARPVPLVTAATHSPAAPLRAA